LTTRSSSATSFEQRVGQVLVEGGFIKADQLQKAMQLSDEKKTGLLDTLVA
jgi:hypothetical protein